MPSCLNTVSRALWPGLLSALLFVSAATAQGGPPPFVRDAVDAVIELLRSEGEAPVDAFIDSAMAPDASFERDEFEARLRAIRETVGGVSGGIAVEGEPDGARIVLDGPGGEHQVRVVLGPEGISDVRLVGESTGPGPRASAPAPADPAAGIRRHVRALEESGAGSLDSVLARFEAEHFSEAFMADTTAEERRALMEQIRMAALAAGGVFVDQRGDEIVLTLRRGPEADDVIFTVEEEAPFAIRTLRLETQGAAPANALVFTRDGIAQEFAALVESEGLSGVVSVRLGGEPVLEQAFGMANPALGIPTQLDTIFGIGSRPIDFTVAAILLLEQRGLIAQSDPISDHFPDVPADKAGMTIAHLMTGRSGLPDFFHTEDDWDADLAWVDRDTAVQRMMAQQLLFAPGEQHSHSHGAFGLLAALVEIVSGQSYADFLRENFFDPAGMERTGFNGERRGFGLSDFAVGGGPGIVGVPNIPPNWGPTSWLVMGSGGMYSTLGDLQRFYAYIRGGSVLEPAFARHFNNATAARDGSDRGFQLYSVFERPGDELFVFLNINTGGETDTGALFRALEDFLIENAGG